MQLRCRSKELWYIMQRFVMIGKNSNYPYKLKPTSTLSKDEGRDSNEPETDFVLLTLAVVI